MDGQTQAAAAGDFVALTEMGIDEKTIRRALAGVSGVKRRFTMTGEAGGIMVVDDYGHERRNLEVIVDEDQLSLAIGRGGQNVRLASELSGWNLNVLSKDEAAAKQDNERE